MAVKSFTDLFDQLSEVAELLCRRGWAEGNAGNISVRITGCEGFDATKLFSAGQMSLHTCRSSLAGQYFMVTGSGTTMPGVSKDPAKNMVFVKVTKTGQQMEIFHSGSAQQEPE